ncbi:MAG: 30S ribosomal protein S8 [Patescibacteria group bacterium]
MVDTISSLIIKLKNANIAGKTMVSFPYSKLREAILITLEKEGFVKAVSKKGKKVTKTVEAELVYVEGKPRITDIEQISKQSRRVYQGAKEIRLVNSGFGALILTTPKGVLTGREARKEKVGGEVLFRIW